MNKWLRRIYKVLSAFGLGTGIYVLYDCALVYGGMLSSIIPALMLLIGFLCIIMNFIIVFVRAWIH